MRKLLSSFLLFGCAIALLAVPAHGQDVSNIYMGGVSGSIGANPPVAGTFLYGRRINSVGTYAFSIVDALPSTSKPFSVTTNIGVGVAQKVATIAGVPILVPTDLAVSYTGTATGYSYTTGAGAVFRVKATDWYVMPTVRILKSNVSGGGYQPIVGVLFGWGQ